MLCPGYFVTVMSQYSASHSDNYSCPPSAASCNIYTELPHIYLVLHVDIRGEVAGGAARARHHCNRRHVALPGHVARGVASSASKSSIRRFVITEKAPTSAFSWLKAATTAFTFKTLLRHYAKRALTPRSLNVKLGLRCNYHKGQAC